MCGSVKHHQQLRGSKNSVVNLISRSILRESIEEPNEKIDFDTDNTVLKVQLVTFKVGTKGIAFWDGGATIVLIRHEPVRMNNLTHLVKSMYVNKPVVKTIAKINLIKNKPEEEKSYFLEAEGKGIQCP